MKKDKQAQILVADDESMVSESFRIALKDNYNVLMASSGKECLEIVKQAPPNLLILDIRLPDMDGIEVLEEIRKFNPSLPVIVITGVGTHQTAIEALKLGADDFIAKPLNFFYLRSVIANSLSPNNKRKKQLPTAEDVIIKNYLSSLKMLNRIMEARDPFTKKHSQRVSAYSVVIARELGLSLEQQEVIRKTALLHDIGKIGISEAILQKPSQLTAEEWIEVQRHAQIGEGFLEPLNVLHIEQTMVRHHHERYDGSGYPDGLKGEGIPLYARILTVADTYEAMTSSRPYRKTVSSSEAVAELERCSGTQFDPKIVQAFKRALNKGKMKQEK